LYVYNDFFPHPQPSRCMRQKKMQHLPSKNCNVFI
jgi:hypothetical protein